jgi:hypothetical protein
MAKRCSEIFRKVQKAGYIVEPTRNGHFKVFPSAERRDTLALQGVDVDNFPAFVLVSGSPSDVNGVRQAQRDLRKIGFTG